jgi:hypothetical protein
VGEVRHPAWLQAVRSVSQRFNSYDSERIIELVANCQPCRPPTINGDRLFGFFQAVSASFRRQLEYAICFAHDPPVTVKRESSCAPPGLRPRPGARVRSRGHIDMLHDPLRPRLPEDRCLKVAVPCAGSDGLVGSAKQIPAFSSCTFTTGSAPVVRRKRPGPVYFLNLFYKVILSL